MLKIRVMPTLLYRDFTLVKGVGFDSWRRVGSAMQAVKVYNMREVDELVFLDIAATAQGREPDYALIDDIADECFMPLTVGGGIRHLDQVRELLRVGADKVTVNSALVEDSALLGRIAARFGSQCCIASIDARSVERGRWEAYIRAGTEPTGRCPIALAQQAEAEGAGEILLTAIERDGTMDGYDLELVAAVTRAVSIPVIASGGAGTFAHMAAALRDAEASALAAASMFHFTERTPLEAKAFLRDAGFPVRI